MLKSVSVIANLLLVANDREVLSVVPNLVIDGAVVVGSVETPDRVEVRLLHSIEL